MRFLLPWLFLGIVSAFSAGCGTNPTPTPIILGHVSDKTRLDKAGDHAELGLRLALHELSEDKAVTEALGNRPIQIRHTDTRGVLDAFESEAVRLDSVNRAAALFGGISAPEVSALDHVKIPILTFHGDPVSGASKNVFYLGMSSEQQGRILAKVLAETAKMERVAILVDERRPEAALSAQSFHQALPEGVAVLTLRFGKDAKWEELTARIANQPAQAVYFAGDVQDFNDWMKTWGKDGLENVPILFAGVDGSQRRFDFDARPKSSILFASAFSTQQPNDKTQTFLKAYREAFQAEAEVNAALAYDGLRMLVDAIKRAQPASLTAERVREELLKTKNFDGLTGPLSITGERQVDRPLFVSRWQNGNITMVRKFPALSEKK
jgi:branched-chain amino acid transport system substrate-binding protein